MKRRNQTMLQGPILPSIISYTVPIILTSLLQLLFNAADLVVVGRYCGSLSVAAVGATGSITNLIVTLFVGLSLGAGVAVAHAIGAKEQGDMHKAVHTAIPVAVIGGLVLTVVGIAFSETFLVWMGTPENVLKLSAVYMRYYFAGMVFNMVYNFAASILRAAGDTRGPLVYLTIAGVINVILNVIFVRFFEMNVVGVALATTISQGVSAVLVVLALMRRTDACRLYLRKLRIYPVQLAKMVQIGLPAGIQGSLFSISNVLIQSSINSFGDVFMSGNAAAGNVEGFVYVSMNAFSQTAMNFCGQNTGAGQYDRVKKILLCCVGCAATVGIVIGGAAYLFGEQLLSIYITDSQEAIAYGVVRFAFLALPYFLCGMMDATTGGLRGMGASVTPMLISIVGVCGIRIVWIYTIFQIPAYHTPESLYFSYPFSWVVTFLGEFVAFMVVYRRKKRRYLQQKSALEVLPGML